MGDAGGDPDWYGYCLDDPVNMVDSTGLMGSKPRWIEENLSWESVLIWRATEGACKACTGMDCTEVPDATDMGSMRPHPNCKCTVELCHDGLELGDWEFVDEDTTGYSVVFVISDSSSVETRTATTSQCNIKKRSEQKIFGEERVVLEISGEYCVPRKYASGIGLIDYAGFKLVRIERYGQVLYAD